MSNHELKIFPIWVLHKPQKSQSEIQLLTFESNFAFRTQIEAQLIRDVLGDPSLEIKLMYAPVSATESILIDSSAFLKELIKQL